MRPAYRLALYVNRFKIRAGVDKRRKVEAFSQQRKHLMVFIPIRPLQSAFSINANGGDRAVFYFSLWFALGCKKAAPDSTTTRSGKGGKV